MFFNKKKSSDNIHKDYFYMAKDILSKLGQSEHEYNSNIAMGGGYFDNKVYKNYGLKIVQPDTFRLVYYKQNVYKEPFTIYIEFCGERVFDMQTYIPGPWEEVFIELHSKIPIILKNIELDAKTYEKYKSITKMLNEITRLCEKDTVIITDDFIISVTTHYTDFDERAESTSYTVIYDKKEVFSAHYTYSKSQTSCSLYIPGLWEKELTAFLEQLRFEEVNKKEQRKIKCAYDNLSKLKNLK